MAIPPGCDEWLCRGEDESCQPKGIFRGASVMQVLWVCINPNPLLRDKSEISPGL